MQMNLHLFASQSLLQTPFSENLPPSVMLADSLSCSDDDDGSNGELMYTIESGNTDTVFEIRDDGTRVHSTSS